MHQGRSLQDYRNARVCFTKVHSVKNKHNLSIWLIDVIQHVIYNSYVTEGEIITVMLLLVDVYLDNFR